MFSEIIPVFSRKPLFGYKVVAVSSLLIAGVSLLVWVHHMFTSVTPGWMREVGFCVRQKAYAEVRELLDL